MLVKRLVASGRQSDVRKRLAHALVGEDCFDLRKARRILDAEPVPKRVRTWIGVRVFAVVILHRLVGRFLCRHGAGIVDETTSPLSVCKASTLESLEERFLLGCQMNAFDCEAGTGMATALRRVFEFRIDQTGLGPLCGRQAGGAARS